VVLPGFEELAPARIATAPIEARGGQRDDARLLVASRSGGDLVDTTFRHLPRFLRPGDLLVVNRSATLAAAVPAADGLLLHLSTELPGGRWVVELRRPCGTGSSPHRDGVAGQVVVLPDGGRALLEVPFGGDADGDVDGGAGGVGTRLWVAELALPEPLLAYLGHHGRPIRYGCTTDAWPLSAYQTVFASEPGSAEMPSAGRAFTPPLLAALRQRGVAMATITLHAGVSSQEAGEPPYAERYSVGEPTVAAVTAARRRGGRVVAVGTTVVRALETVATDDGLAPGSGWTELVITPERGVRVVDGLVTGWHEPEASHLQLLGAVAGTEVLTRSYAAAVELGHLWHEFGDLHLILP
jgi:S-adenosylmethionine:tRNA ribosyltransferase-isomerase